MMLPVALIENIRALVARKQIMGKRHDVQWYVPVLGQYAYDSLNTNDYTYAAPGTDPSNSFLVESVMLEKKLDIKGKIVTSKIPETAIDLVDGAASNILVWINDPARLKVLVSFWNEWLATLNLQAYSMTLDTMGTERGISSLTSVAMTRHWVKPPPTVQEQMDTVVDSRAMKHGLLTSVYSQRLAVVDTSQGIILSVPYEQILNFWILPTNYSNFGVSQAAQSNNIRWQAIMGEPFAAAQTTGEDGVFISFLHDSYASHMVKSRTGTNNALDKYLLEQAAAGRGGVLAGIGSALDSILGF